MVNPIDLSRAKPEISSPPSQREINIDRLVRQEEHHYYCDFAGTKAGIFHMKAPEFKDIARNDVDWKIIESIFEKENQTGVNTEIGRRAANG